MENLFKSGDREKRGFSPVFIVATLIGILVIGVALWVLSWKPSMDDQIANVLEGSYKPGSPEFEELNKDIVIATGNDTVESPTGLGTIAMYIQGRIRNRGTRTFDILEINVAVVTQFNDVLRERRVLVVPVQRSVLGPDETIPVTLQLDGFSPEDDRANIRWRVTAIRAVTN